MFKKIPKSTKILNKKTNLRNISKIERDSNYKFYINKKNKNYKRCRRNFIMKLSKINQKGI